MDLREWRTGQTMAERLCAGVLAINDFVDLDPQAPVGGPDDRKDILAQRAGLQYVCAVFFPPTPQTFGAIRRKFLQDREGVERHGADAFVFLLNQRLSLTQRQQLLELGGPNDHLYHLERLRLALDSPQGYGLRQEFLRRSTTIEELIAYLSTLSSDAFRQYRDRERRLAEGSALDNASGLIEKAMDVDAASRGLGDSTRGIDNPSQAPSRVTTLRGERLCGHHDLEGFDPGHEESALLARSIQEQASNFGDSVQAFVVADGSGKVTGIVAATDLYLLPDIGEAKCLFWYLLAIDQRHQHGYHTQRLLLGGMEALRTRRLDERDDYIGEVAVPLRGAITEHSTLVAFLERRHFFRLEPDGDIWMRPKDPPIK